VENPASPPPPPRPKSTRKFTRYEMYASVELHSESETMILPARNISLGGVFLADDGHDLDAFAIGAQLQVMVFDALDDQRKPVRVLAEVLRREPGGIALMWSDSDPQAAIDLARLLDGMHPKTDPPPKR
jgi:hypothetical protein